MRTLKHWFEKPTFVWGLVAIAYTALLLTVYAEKPSTELETQHISILNDFAESTFPPKIGLIKNLPDWQGRVGYFAIMGRVFGVLKGDLFKLRLASMILALAALLVFVKVGYTFVHLSRFNPIWVSVALLLFAANPYYVESAFQVQPMNLFLLLLLLATWCFRKDRVGLGGMFLSLATLVDWTALLLAIALCAAKILENDSRVLRIERVLALLLPFFVGALPFITWKGIVPEGEAREMFTQFWANRPFFRLDALYYSMALLPIYGLYFTWAWGFRSRVREQLIGAIITGLSIPIFFLFPAKDETGRLLGLMDEIFHQVSEQYKNLLLFIPWIIGMFLFTQLLLFRARDRSRSLRFYIVLFFLAQPFVIGSGDREFLAVVPFLLLYSLSESLVGEEGKLV